MTGLLKLCLFFVVVSLVNGQLFQGWLRPRYPSNDVPSECEVDCLCGTAEETCNIRCPGECVDDQLEFPPSCDPTSEEEGPVIIQSTELACSVVLSKYTGGVSTGRPLKMPGQFTTLGDQYEDEDTPQGDTCFTTRLGDSDLRQTVYFELCPPVKNVAGFFDFVVYEKANGTLDDYIRGDTFDATVLGGTPAVPDDYFPEAFTLQVQKASGEWSDWYFQGIDILINGEFPDADFTFQPTDTSYEIETDTYMTAYDFSAFGVSAGQSVVAIRIANLQPEDRVFGAENGTFGWVAFDGEGCEERECFRPQFVGNGELLSYSTNNFDPDIFWVSEIILSDRESQLEATTGTTGTTGTSATTATTGTTGTGAPTSGTTGTTGTTGTIAPETSGTTGTTDIAETTGTTGTTEIAGTTGTTATTEIGETTGTSATTGTTSTGTTATTGTLGGVIAQKAVILSVSPRFGSPDMNPDGVQVFAENIVENERFRCLFGQQVETEPISFSEDSVFCRIPSEAEIPTNSRFSMVVQLLNDNLYYDGVSNTYPFVILIENQPEIVSISPNSADRFCVSQDVCEPIEVLGFNLASADSIDCVYFGSYTKPGRFEGTTRVGGVVYDKVVCDQVAVYPETMTEAETRDDGFYLLLYRQVSGPVASTTVEFTYTCDPCDE